MAKPNYRQAKRHKELARKARQEQKLRRRTGREASTPDAEQNAAPASPSDGLPPPSENST